MPKGNFDDTEKVQKIIARLLKLPRISIQTARNLELLKQHVEGEIEALKEHGRGGGRWPQPGQAITAPKRPYQLPVVRKFECVEDLPGHQREAAKRLLDEVEELVTIIDTDRRWVSVSEPFARLLGYRTMDMIGKKVDDFIVENSVDIRFAFRALTQIGEMDGMWMFRHRDGQKILVHYHARFSSGMSHAELQPLLVA